METLLEQCRLKYKLRQEVSHLKESIKQQRDGRCVRHTVPKPTNCS